MKSNGRAKNAAYSVTKNAMTSGEKIKNGEMTVVRMAGPKTIPSVKPIPPAKKNNCLKSKDSFLTANSETMAKGIYIP